MHCARGTLQCRFVLLHVCHRHSVHAGCLAVTGNVLLNMQQQSQLRAWLISLCVLLSAADRLAVG